ncbi:MAG: hypothetical protein SPJ62_06110 [Inconstantimicrobium porci]|uniref:hypothetical protein n=1 Tax=Inconstantimicrobium porci TaxID=2652291 RepID=UPI002A90D15D|nr:hypothetical protein [Inconstantimicrobium porci]MDY5911574.1 hypothetical protein [Inconstantimicrobium porci]
MKKNKIYFIIVFLIIAVSLGFNVFENEEAPDKMAISIDVQQEYRNNVVKEVNKILGKSIPVRINNENNCKLIIKHESQITDVQRQQYKVIKLLNDPVVIVDKSKSTIESVNLKDKTDRIVAGRQSVVDFVNSKIKDTNKLYVGDKDPYKLVMKENIFYGLSYLHDFTNSQIPYLKVIKINDLDYNDSSYILNDSICILVKNGEGLDSINEKNLSAVINKEER